MARSLLYEEVRKTSSGVTGCSNKNNPAAPCDRARSPNNNTCGSVLPRRDQSTRTTDHVLGPSLANNNKLLRGTGDQGPDASARPTTRTMVAKGAPPATIPTSRGEADPLPSWLDYCFEYEAVNIRSANKDNNIASLFFSLVTAVRIQGDLPSRRRISSRDAARML